MSNVKRILITPLGKNPTLLASFLNLFSYSKAIIIGGKEVGSSDSIVLSHADSKHETILRKNNKIKIFPLDVESLVGHSHVRIANLVLDEILPCKDSPIIIHFSNQATIVEHTIISWVERSIPLDSNCQCVIANIGDKTDFHVVPRFVRRRNCPGLGHNEKSIKMIRDFLKGDETDISYYSLQTKPIGDSVFMYFRNEMVAERKSDGSIWLPSCKGHRQPEMVRTVEQIAKSIGSDFI